MTLIEKIQHVINQLSDLNTGDTITLDKKFKKAVRTITEKKIFGYELEMVEEWTQSGKSRGTNSTWHQHFVAYKLK